MGNTIIKVNCLDQRLILSSMPLIASGGVNEDIAEFSFCPLWDGFAKTAIFYRDETEKYYAIIDSENKCVIPWEVLQSDGKVFFGVYGVKGDVRRTTEILGYKIKLGAFDEKLKPSEPTPDIYSQYVNRIIEVENRVTPIEEFTINPSPFELTGNPIQMQNFEGMPLNVVTTFEPKQEGSGDPSPDNVRPISGYDVLGLTRCGKNLFDKNWLLSIPGTTVENEAFTIQISQMNAHYASGFPAKFKANTQYTLSFRGYISNAGNDPYLSFAHTDGSIARAMVTNTTENEYVISSAPGKTVKTLFATFANNGSGTVTLKNVQLEEGSSASAFSAYPDTYSANPDQTVYGGRMNWTTGELLVTKTMMALTGNSIHDYFSDWHAATIKLSDGQYGEVKCSHYVDSNGSTNKDNSIYFRSAYYGDRICGIKDARFSTKADYAAYLDAQNAAGTPVQIVYYLAAPYTIPFTPHQILALKGSNTLYGDGEITVSGRKDILWLTSNLIERIKTLEEAVISLGGNV